MAQKSIKSFLGTSGPTDKHSQYAQIFNDTTSSNVENATNRTTDFDDSIPCGQRTNRNSSSRSKSQSNKKDKQAKKAARKRQREQQKNANRRTKQRESNSNMTSTSDKFEESTEIINQSLTELLATNNSTVSGTPKASSSPSRPDSPTKESLKDRIHELEKCVSDMSKENSSLQHQTDLLNAELENAKKVNKTSKTEIKRLTKDNDNLRREISRISGLRRYVSDDENGNKDNEDRTCNNDELQTANAKLDSLRVHMADVANTLLSLASEERSDMSRVSTQSSHQQRTTPPTSPTPESFPIPVVPIGLARREATTSSCPASPTPMAASSATGTYAHAAAQRPQQQRSRPPHKPQVCVIGTSLTRGLGQRLASQGLNVTTYTYPGAQIPYIRSRVPYILPKDNEQITIVLQCGGNDADKQNPDRIIDQYEGLIKDIRRQRPNAEIMTSTIPPRRMNRETFKRINYVNDYLKDRVARNDRVRMLDVVPKQPKYFAKDQVHFNDNGRKLYACNIITSLSNFTRGTAGTPA